MKTRKDLEKMFDEYFEGKDEVEIINNIYIKQFIFDTVVPEILKNIMPGDNIDTAYYFTKDGIKQKAKELYSIDL